MRRLKQGLQWFVFCLYAVSPVALAQPEEELDQLETQGEEQQGETQADDGTEETDDAQVPPSIDDQPIQAQSGQAPERFIPSEQISLDLGVSFPVDI